MSDNSDDEFPDTTTRQRTEEAAAAVRDIADLSDDESEEERKPSQDVRPSPPSPVPDDDEPGRSDEDGFKHEDEDEITPKNEPVVEEDGQREDREETPDIDDKYERYAVRHGQTQHNVDILHFPPSVSFHMSLTTDLADLPVEENPILFRLKPEMRRKGQSDAQTLLEFVKKNPDPFALRKILETNAHLITWSDGSKTITIGNEQFLLIDDVIASKHYVFRRGDRIQTFEAEVGGIRRVQPSTTGSATAKIALAKAQKRARSSGFGPTGRTMMRCMDDGGELEEEKAKQESLRRHRERLKMEARRRQARERNMRPSRGLTTELLESNDEDSGEDEKMRRIEERVGESRLMRAKRAAPPRIEVSVKRRKAGGRRVLSDSDDGDDEIE
ncbi:hypothetical protein BWQ96_04500 [Gracilariopsis chorda]|uniref:RNA polymerase-associated protein LEO1 n=1 Tax=Gracilariopsis chorda TaxID=448386 RepID=A0A2V3IUD9_9FLOR|nr:hypothetical protein BWQ96_04500 [Gracilariopsis chorda]|eukprot:PXF45732.1 hypothetical protein BWQ96_04500 [Gracilariopsis chorda]